MILSSQGHLIYVQALWPGECDYLILCERTEEKDCTQNNTVLSALALRQLILVDACNMQHSPMWFNHLTDNNSLFFVRNVHDDGGGDVKLGRCGFKNGISVKKN